MQVVGGAGGQRRGDHLWGIVGAPGPLVGDVKSFPTARGRMPRLERKKQGAGTCLEGDGGGTAPSDGRWTCWEGC